MRGHQTQDLGLEGILDLFPNNAHINLQGVFKFPHIHAVSQGVGELSATVFLLEPRQKKIFIVLIDIFCAPAGALIDGVNDNIHNGLAQQASPLTLRN